MIQPNLIATDIDGTLVETRGAPLSDFTLGTLQALLDQGAAVTLVTGLNPWVARRYLTQIDHGVRAICLNGIFTLEDGTLHTGEIVGEEVARQAVELILEQGHIPLVFGTDGITRYCIEHRSDPAEVNQLIAERSYQPYEQVGEREELFTVRPTQVSVCERPTRTEPLYRDLAQALGDRAYVVHQPSARAWVEINHPKARKDVALLAMARRLGISEDSVLYFGDSLNDLPVFHRLPYVVAMANARPEVKALAWRTAPHVREDGVARFLRDLLGLDAP